MFTRSNSLFIEVCLLAILLGSLAFGWYSHACGLLLTYDSHQYLAAGQHFRQSFELMGAEERPYEYWPPLFPVFLSLFSDPLSSITIFYGLLKICLFVLLRQVSLNTFKYVGFTIGYLVLIFWGVHLLLISTFLWSELLFVLFLIAFVFSLERFQSKTWRRAIPLLFGFLLCLQRNAGLFVICGASAWLFFVHTEGTWKQRWARPIQLFFICTSGLWIWNVYVSFFTSSDFKFYNHAFFASAMHNFNLLSQSITKAFVPLASGGWFVFLATAGVCVYSLRSELKEKSITSLSVWIILSYLLGMTFVFWLEPTEGDRFISVILPLLTLVVFRALEKIYTDRPRAVRWLVIGALVLGCIYPFGRTVKNAIRWHEMSCSPVITSNSFSR